MLPFLITHARDDLHPGPEIAAPRAVDPCTLALPARTGPPTGTWEQKPPRPSEGSLPCLVGRGGSGPDSKIPE